MGSLVELGLTDEESQTVDPSSDDGVSNVSYTVILEDQVVTSYDGRVDEVEPVTGCVRAVVSMVVIVFAHRDVTHLKASDP